MAKAIDLIAVATAEAVIPTAGLFAGIAYLLVGDGLFDGRSPGKKVMGLRVVSASSGDKGSFRDSMIRNTPFVLAVWMFYAIPFVGWVLAAAIFVFEFLLILGNIEGMRFGDDLAGSRVIEG
jgi:uncharacterized RDD family membrane protein YckC